ncbi:MAG: hypothetical protein DRO15_03520 [Thermoprotei archaeon]|nr:MAG: hypothetical protein DRO15_03520 [Thermoprotei archaeon]
MPRLLIELAQRFFLCKGYLISIRYPFKMRRQGKGGKIIESTKFVDILAYRRNELILIRCASFKNVRRIKRAVQKLKLWFKAAENYLEEEIANGKFPANNIKFIRRVIIIPDEELEKRTDLLNVLKSQGINVITASTILSELEKCIEEREAIRSGEERGEGDLFLSLIRFTLRYGVRNNAQ